MSVRKFIELTDRFAQLVLDTALALGREDLAAIQFAHIKAVDRRAFLRVDSGRRDIELEFRQHL